MVDSVWHALVGLNNKSILIIIIIASANNGWSNADDNVQMWPLIVLLSIEIW